MNLSRRIKRAKVVKSDLAWTLDRYKIAKSFLEQDKSYRFDADGAITNLFDLCLNVLESNIKLSAEALNSKPVECIVPKTSYIIFPDGTMYKTGTYNHIGFYLFWVLTHKPEKYMDIIVNRQDTLCEDFNREHGTVEFSFGGDYCKAVMFEGIVINRKQKEILLQMYEINGAARQYFDDVERV